MAHVSDKVKFDILKQYVSRQDSEIIESTGGRVCRT